MHRTSLDRFLDRRTARSSILRDLAAGGVALVAVISLVCGPTVPAQASSWTRVYRSADSGSTLRTFALTADAPNTYRIARSRGDVTALAPKSNTSNNRREIFWPNAVPAARNRQVCATWQSQTQARSQEGLALAIRSSTAETRAVTITKNVVYGVSWTFNVHTWRVTPSAAEFKEIASFDMRKVLIPAPGAHLASLPWRVCARIVGRNLTFKLWLPNEQREPAWTDTKFTRRVVIPAAFAGAGATGWYVGHLPRGGAVRYRDLEIWSQG